MARVFVAWQEKETESGITLSAGPTTIERRGELLSSHAFPMQNNGQIGFMVSLVVRRIGDNKVVVIDGLSAVCVGSGPDDEECESLQSSVVFGRGGDFGDLP